MKHHQSSPEHLLPPAARFQLPLAKTRGLHKVCVLKHMREAMALRQNQARGLDSWAQVDPPAIQLPDSVCSSVRSEA